MLRTNRKSVPYVSPSLERTESVFDSVRAGYEFVARVATHVTIRHDRLDAYADSLPGTPPRNTLDAGHHYRGDPESVAAYILILDSVNFGSGYEPHMVAEGWELIDHSIYYSLSTRLKALFEKSGPVPADRLSRFTAEDCLAVLALNPGGPCCRAFAELCAASLRELGQVIQTRYGGSYLAMIRDAGGSAEAMLGILTGLSHFNDVHVYRGLSVPFFKRAQITVADLHLAFRQFGETLFSDIDQLTMFPDNGVPHVFRVDGILEYTPALAARIDCGEEIPSGSEEEIEIRACAGHVVELIAARKKMIAMDVDHILWHRHVEEPRYLEGKTHKTLSQFY